MTAGPPTFNPVRVYYPTTTSAPPRTCLACWTGQHGLCTSPTTAGCCCPKTFVNVNFTYGQSRIGRLPTEFS